MRPRDNFASSPHRDSDLLRMKTRTPREILEWLCEGDDMRHYWKKDGSLNIHRLSQDIKKQIPGTRLSQSTLARAYDQSRDGSATFHDETIATLSQFFDVPKAIIRGDVDFDPVEMWGMDIGIHEIRLLRMLRLLSPEQRRAIYEQIRVMLPPELQAMPVGPPPTNVTSLTGRKPAKRR